MKKIISNPTEFNIQLTSIYGKNNIKGFKRYLIHSHILTIVNNF